MQRRAAAEGPVFLGDGAFTELSGEVLLCVGSEGEENDAGGVGVDAVDKEGLYALEGRVGGKEVNEAFGTATAG